MTFFDPDAMARMPFHFWTVILFIFGSVVGSFLNVCIYRMPRGESIVHPPSHCPHCNYSIPWYLNMPLITWVVLRGRCANCGAPISVRYFLVELLTGLMFAACWIAYAPYHPLVALIYCLFISGLIAASFIDLEHYIIPDEITLGGIVVGLACSLFVPQLHASFPSFRPYFDAEAGFASSVAGAGVGALLILACVQLGKLAFGRHTVTLEPNTKILFTETALKLPNEEIPFEEIFFRQTDSIRLQASRLELADCCYTNVAVRLQPKRLQIGGETFDPEQIRCMEAVTESLILPREAMGLGDLKFVAAFGAFLGWPAVLFSFFAGSAIGALVGVILILVKKKERYSQIPFGPFLALGAVAWIFFGRDLTILWLRAF